MSVLKIKDGNQWATIPTIKGTDGHSPVITASKTDGVTTIYVDGVAIATINDGDAGSGGGGGTTATTIVNKTASDTSQTLEDNTFYIWPEMSTLTITYPNTITASAFRFTSGSTATTLTMNGVTMPAGFMVEANRIYEINIFEGYGLAASWEVS